MIQEDEMSSECSSGCQSGWTMYLAQSSDEQSSLRHKDASSFHEQEEEEEEQEEEDLSMISDASSGPPQLHEVDDERGHYYRHSTPRWESNGCLHFASAPAAAMGRDGGKKRRAEAAQQRDHSSVLDDTASSQLLSSSQHSINDCSNHMKQSMDISYGFSTTHFKARSAPQERMGYSRSSSCVKPTPSRPVPRKEGRRKMW
ncbi:protein SOB FIVE-LIKE 5-like [Musa acuminata AAA Group]|uniref:protein SOB FIVE-LIKE 5-like n=1 Tax=Musa acuminata AAA Group TaxID=214697 RepID=UPI0031DC928A